MNIKPQFYEKCSNAMDSGLTPLKERNQNIDGKGDEKWRFSNSENECEKKINFDYNIKI